MICRDPVCGTCSGQPARSISTLSCGHSYHLTCIGKRFNTAGGKILCSYKCKQQENDSSWALASDAHLVGIVFNVLRKLQANNNKVGRTGQEAVLEGYDDIYTATDKMGLPRKMVRVALGTLARGYITRKGNSVILTGIKKPILAGSAITDESDDGQPGKC